MFTRILYPTDFSSVSAKAADHIRQLKDAGAEEVTVLHVIDSAAMMAPATPGVLGGIGTTPALSQSVIEDWQRSATEECEGLAESLRSAGLRATAAVEVGRPADVILELSRDADVIVMGASGKGHLAERILGSGADEVGRKSHIPVLVIKP